MHVASYAPIDSKAEYAPCLTQTDPKLTFDSDVARLAALKYDKACKRVARCVITLMRITLTTITLIILIAKVIGAPLAATLDLPIAYWRCNSHRF